MKLYNVTRDDSRVDWDEYSGFVIAARSEKEARAIASNMGGNDFLDPKVSISEFIGRARSGMKAGVVLSDFKRG